MRFQFLSDTLYTYESPFFAIVECFCLALRLTVNDHPNADLITNKKESPFWIVEQEV